jgi:hypothetical protein
MKINSQHRAISACLATFIAVTSNPALGAGDTRATATAEASGAAAKSSATVEASGSFITSVLTSDGKIQKVTVTTVGPDGKVHTVTNEGMDGKLPLIPVHLPDGKRMAKSLHPSPSRIERVTYAGIVVEEVPEILSKHLPIPKGLGLVVTEVLQDSPADKAGIRKDDILLRFDDQLLASQDQLRKLTRSRKNGDRVRFGLVHEGRESMVEITLAEREEDTANPGRGPWQPFGWMKASPDALPNLREAAEQARLKAAEMGKAADEIRRRLAVRPEKGSDPEQWLSPGGDALERIERELRRLQEDIQRLREATPSRDSEQNRRERPARGARDEERPPGTPRDGERP